MPLDVGRWMLSVGCSIIVHPFISPFFPPAHSISASSLLEQRLQPRQVPLHHPHIPRERLVRHPLHPKHRQHHLAPLPVRHHPHRHVHLHPRRHVHHVIQHPKLIG